jgi:Ca2+-binding RTX toxin-like protein
MRGFRRGAIGALALSLAAPGIASSEPVHVVAVGPGEHGPPGLVVVTGSIDADRVTVKSPAPDIVDASSGAGVVADTGCQYGGVLVPAESCGCQSVDFASATCRTHGAAAVTRLLSGDDVARAGGSVSLGARGGRGADRLTGDEMRDFLQGAQGRDRLSARGGDDELDGGTGRDAAFGGRGDDVLALQDGDRDRVIDCGPGDDLALIDNNDPRAQGCETISEQAETSPR